MRHTSYVKQMTQGNEGLMEYAVLYYDSQSGDWEDTLGKEGQLTSRWIQGLAELLNLYAAEGWQVANERGVGTSHIVILERTKI